MALPSYLALKRSNYEVRATHSFQIDDDLNGMLEHVEELHIYSLQSYKELASKTETIDQSSELMLKAMSELKRLVDLVNNAWSEEYLQEIKTYDFYHEKELLTVAINKIKGNKENDIYIKWLRMHLKWFQDILAVIRKNLKARTQIRLKKTEYSEKLKSYREHLENLNKHYYLAIRQGYSEYYTSRKYLSDNRLVFLTIINEIFQVMEKSSDTEREKKALALNFSSKEEVEKTYISYLDSWENWIKLLRELERKDIISIFLSKLFRLFKTK